MMVENDDLSGFGNLSPELVPVVETGATELALPPAAGAGTDVLALGDLLSDALFGEVIDISELIPRVMSPSAGATPEVAGAEPAAAEFGTSGGSDAVVVDGHPALTILYDDDILASDSGIL